MSRPLVVTDCDEVLLHMVRHFRDWLGEAHGIDFLLDGNPFAHRCGAAAAASRSADAEKWRYLRRSSTPRCTARRAIEGAAAAIAELPREADVVVLTNLTDSYQRPRDAPAARHGDRCAVFTNQGPKGPALQRIVEQYAPEPRRFRRRPGAPSRFGRRDAARRLAACTSAASR